MKILSRNVNGIRSAVKKWFVETIQGLNPDVVALQETKAFYEQCPDEVKDLGYHICRHAGTRPWYAGTALLTKDIPHVSCSTFPHTIFHDDGRVTEVRFGDTLILNIYFPNGGTRADGTEMLWYKLNFYDTLITYLSAQKEKNIVIIGDYNVCHTEIDIARPKENVNSIWFLPVERKKVTEFLSHGFVDVFRYLNPDARDQYTWWSYRAWAKQNNVGRRIDYACVSAHLTDNIQWFQHFPHIWWSDHCPIMLEIDL